MADDVDLVRSRTDIVALVGQRVALKKAGRHYKGLCPFHDDRNPSFQVSPEIGRYTCWSCGEKGDAFDWVMKTQNVDFPEALKLLAAEAGVTLSRSSGRQKAPTDAFDACMEEALAYFRGQLQSSPEARAYAETRGLGGDVGERWEVGYAPDVGYALANHLQKKGLSLSEARKLFLVDQDASGGYYDRFRARLLFPIRDERGRLVAFGGRLVGEGHPKYINSGDTVLYSKSKVLYGLNRAREAVAASRSAVLVEGYLDVIACHRAGVGTAVATLGTALADDHSRLLKRFADEVTILYDGDAAGQKAAERACDMLAPSGFRIKVAVFGEGDDPDTVLSREGPEAVLRAVKEAVSPLDFTMARLRSAHSPTEDAFWKEAVAVLAAVSDQLEVEKHLVALASQYPGLRDPVAAQGALRKQVLAASKRSSAPARAVVTPGSMSPASPIPGYQATVFRCLAVAHLRLQAWEACGEGNLFDTSEGAALAEAVRSSFPDAPPAGSVADWLTLVQPEQAQDRLAGLLFSQSGPVNEEDLAAALGRLRNKRDARHRHDLRRKEAVGEGSLRAISESLRAAGKGRPL